MSIRDHATVTSTLIWYALVVVLIGGALTAAGYMALPYLLGWKRAAYKASHQYIEARQSVLSKLAADVAEIDAQIEQYQAADSGKPEGRYQSVIRGLENQRKALIARMRREADRLAPEEIPYEARKYFP